MDKQSLTPLNPSLLKAPPGPSAPLSPDAFKDPLQFLLSLNRDYGDVAQFPSAYGPVYLVNHPDFIRDIFHDGAYVRVSLLKMALGEGVLTSEGAYWRSQRRQMQPAFHRECIASLDTLITDATHEMAQEWRPFVDSGQPVDINNEMTRLTLRIIGKALFSVDFVAIAGVISNAITTCLECVEELWIFASTQNVSSSFNLRFREAMRTLDEIVLDLIKQRRRNKESSNDLLDLLLAAETENGQPLSDRQVRDEIVTMLLAGHETTANMLAWTWFLLSEHPVVERELCRELSAAIGKRTAKSQDLVNLPYAKMIIQESMRLYPPVWILFRKALVDHRVGDYLIPANTMVALSAYAMHRHPCYWDKPDQFDPERFSPDRASDLPHYAYFPFGGGPHLCMGNHFATMEGILVLATVAQHYRFRRISGHPVEPKPFITLRLRHGLRMTLESSG
ncbi:MAG: cytochrome P450 [Candidatus Binatia bacterium]